MDPLQNFACCHRTKGCLLSIHGLGCDITSISRIQSLYDNYGSRFMERIFRSGEIQDANSRRAPASFLAGRWAAREAFLNALGMDVRLIPYRDIEVLKEPVGPVSILLHGRAKEAFTATGAKTIHLSISHEREYAMATVIIEV